MPTSRRMNINPRGSQQFLIVHFAKYEVTRKSLLRVKRAPQPPLIEMSGGEMRDLVIVESGDANGNTITNSNSKTRFAKKYLFAFMKHPLLLARLRSSAALSGRFQEAEQENIWGNNRYLLAKKQA